MTDYRFKVSVAICTFNGASRITKVIQSLASQNQPFETWELIVIDNASTDGTDKLCRTLFLQFPLIQGKLVKEERAGLSYARAKAATEARGEIICFLDDDNIPAPDFVAAAMQAFVEKKRAGVIGGKVHPRWETKPTPLAEAVAPFALAICDMGEESLRIEGLGGGIVGAGMCIRTKVIREIYRDRNSPAQVTGRKGKTLMSGEDLAISVMARALGWECWYVPAIKVEHILPAGRMEKEYLLRLYEGIGRGQAATRKCFDWKARTPVAWLIGLKDLCRWQLGQWLGPSAELKQRHASIDSDLHDLQQNMILGRALQSFSWPR